MEWNGGWKQWLSVVGLLVCLGMCGEAQIPWEDEVEWARLSGMSAQIRSDGAGSELTVIASRNGMGEARSGRMISGDGWVDFQPGSGKESMEIGLWEASGNGHGEAHRFCLEANGRWAIREQGKLPGVGPGKTGRYQKGDQFRIERRGQAVLYFQGGREIWRVGGSAADLLVIGMGRQGRVTGLRYFGPSEVEDVQWESMSEGALGSYKTPGAGSRFEAMGRKGWESALGSRRIFGDGEVMFGLGQASREVFLGLSFEERGRNASAMDFAFVFRSGKTEFAVVEAGIEQRTERYRVEDRFRIRRVGNTIEFEQNGRVVWRTEGGGGGGSLLVISGASGPQAALIGCRCRGADEVPKLLWIAKAGIEVKYKSGWSRLEQKESGGSLCAESQKTLSGDGFVRFEFGQLQGWAAVGWKGAGRQLVLRADRDGGLEIFENQQPQRLGLHLDAEDQLVIERRGETLRVHRNESVLYESAGWRIGPLRAVASFAEAGDVIQKVVAWGLAEDLVWRAGAGMLATHPQPGAGTTLSRTRLNPKLETLAEALPSLKDGGVFGFEVSRFSELRLELRLANEGTQFLAGSVEFGRDGKWRMRQGSLLAGSGGYEENQGFEFRRDGVELSLWRIGEESPLASFRTERAAPLRIWAIFQRPDARLAHCWLYGNPDSDGNGLDDRWESRFLAGQIPVAEGDADGDFLNDQEEFRLGSSPVDPFNGAEVRIGKVGGDGQRSGPGSFALWPLQVEVTNALGNRLVDAPVRFTVGEGGFLTRAPDPSSPVFSSLVVRTEPSNGLAQVYLRMPTRSGSQVQIQAGSGLAVPVQFALSTQSLFGWWRFEENEGAIAYDSAGSGFDGQLRGEARRGTGFGFLENRQAGQALELNGKGALEIQSREGFGIFNQGWTVSAWIQTDVGAALEAGAIFPIVSQGNLRLALMGQSYNGLCCRIFDGNQVKEIYPRESVVDQLCDGDPHLVAFSRGSTGGGILFIDGKDVSTGADGLAVDMAGPLAGAEPFWIGRAGEDYFRGGIDEVRLWAEALRAEDLVVLWDRDRDGLPDWWERKWFGDLRASIDGDDDGDGIANFEELAQHKNPTDFYNGQVPGLRIVGGQAQRTIGGSWLLEPLTVEVSAADGSPINHAPVEFVLWEGDGQLGGIREEQNPRSKLVVRTRADGRALVWWRKGFAETEIVKVAALGKGNGLEFTAGLEELPVVNFNRTGGRFTTEQQVGLTCEQSGVKIHYTLDGSEPGLSDSMVESGGMILISESARLKARAILRGYTASPIAELNFEITGAIAVGGGHHLVLRADGTVWGWGFNGSGQLGNGTQVDQDEPVQVLRGPESPLGAIVAIAAGADFGLALDRSGRVWAWGYNGDFELGDGTKLSRTFAVAVQTGPLAATAIAAGRFHGLALMEDGTVRGWGLNSDGELADGTNVGKSSSVVIQGSDGLALRGVARIACGGWQSFAVTKAGAVWGWGWNGHGQLGLGQNSSSLRARLIGGLSGDQALASGTAFSVSLAESGALQAWGFNQFGSLGLGFNNSAASPDVLAITPWAAGGPVFLELDCGNLHGLGLSQEGEIWGWGRNADFQLGSSVGDQNQAIPIGLPERVATIGAGEWQSGAIDENGGVWFWGASYSNGSWVQQKSPQRHPTFGALHLKDSDGDGLRDWQELAAGTDCLDPSDPKIRVAAGNRQRAPIDTMLFYPLEVEVFDRVGRPIANVEIEYSIEAGGGTLLGLDERPRRIQRTDSQGRAQLLFKTPLFSGESLIGARIRGASTSAGIEMVAYTMEPPTIRPPSPTELITVVTNSGLTELRWTAPVGNQEEILIQWQQPNGSWQVIGKVGPGMDHFETEMQGNFRIVAANRIGKSRSAQSDPLPTRYSVVDLGTDLYPQRLTNSGYVLLGGTRRWYKGKLTELTGGSASDMSETGTAVGAISLTDVYRRPPPLDLITHRPPAPLAQQAALWTAEQSSPGILGASVFNCHLEYIWGFDSNQAAITTRFDAKLSWSSAQTIDEDRMIYGEAMGPTGYRQDGDTVAKGVYNSQYARVVDGYAWGGNSSSMGTLELLLDQKGGGDRGDYVLKGQGRRVSKARNGVLIGQVSEADQYAVPLGNFWGISSEYLGDSKTTVNGEIVNYRPLYLSNDGTLCGLDSAGCFLIAKGGAPERIPIDGSFYAGFSARNVSVLAPDGSEQRHLAATFVGDEYEPNTYISHGAVLVEEVDGTYRKTFINALLGDDGRWEISYAYAINDKGLILAQGWFEGRDFLGNPVGEPVWRSVLLVPSFLEMDANRDGEMSLVDRQVRAADVASRKRPYRIWLNNDQDAKPFSMIPGEIYGAPNPDYLDEIIQGPRDCEDLGRLWISLRGMADAFQSNDVKVFLRLKGSGSSHPGVRFFRAAESDGGQLYLKDVNWGIAQSSVPYEKALRSTFGYTAIGMYPLDLKLDLFPGVSEIEPDLHLLFEGVAEGIGQLILEFWRDGQMIGESQGPWIEVKDIRKMYDRGDLSGKSQWAYFPYSPASDETPEVIVFVHGWNMAPHEAESFVETMFKRLWWRGFRGRFAAVRWDTYYSSAFEDFFSVGQAVDSFLAKFNESEQIAWKTGGALKRYIDGLPANYQRLLVAHSMGNVVIASALEEGLQAHRYSLLNAALAAACYDEREELRQVPSTKDVNLLGLTIKVPIWNHPSPDADPDPLTRALAHRGRLKNVAVPMVSFYLPDDIAVTYAWDLNNALTKPPALAIFDRNYHYDPEAQPGQKLYKSSLFGGDRYMTERHESLPFACRSWGKAVGAEPRTEGKITGRVNLGAAPFNLPGRNDGFGNVHSAVFVFDIHRVWEFYGLLLKSLNLPFNE